MLVIIDYQMGNLRSVQKGFEKVGHQATISGDPRDLAHASRIVLPGVGAFGDAMAELRRRQLIAPIREAIAAGKPFLGICLGLQLLFDVGYEGGTHEGLGVLPGKVVRFNLSAEYKVPHMGWNELRVRQPNPLLDGLAADESVYFVHSYYVVPQDTAVVATETDYGGPFCSMIARDRLYATQFHPEKSQAAGLKMLRNFAERG